MQNATEFFRIGVRALLLADICRHRFGSTSHAWELGAPMPVARQELATGVLDGKLYVIDGFDENGSSTATVQFL